MTTHSLSISNQLVNAANTDTINLPSLAGLPLTYFGIVTIDTNSQYVDIVPSAGQKINGNTGSLRYDVVGFNVLFITVDRSLGWIVTPLAIDINDLLVALDLPAPTSPNRLIGANSAGTAYESKTLVSGSNITITHGTGTITISSTGGGGGGSAVDPYRKQVIYQPANSYSGFYGYYPASNVGKVFPVTCFGNQQPFIILDGGSVASSQDETPNFNAYMYLGTGTSNNNYTVLSTPSSTCGDIYYEANGTYSQSVSLSTNGLNSRVWLGLYDSTEYGNGQNYNLYTTDDPNTIPVNFIGFRFSKSANDLNWQAVCANKDTGSTIVDTGVSVSVNTKYKMYISCTPTAIEFFINDMNISVATITTNLPDTYGYLGLYNSVVRISGDPGFPSVGEFGRAVLECDC